MITFNEINSFAYLSQETIFTLILSGVNLRQLQHWYRDIGDQDIEFWQWLVQQDFDTGIPVWKAKFWSPKAQICHLN